ncbi:MAG: GDP-mannose 4,6-dehydratase [Litorilinea sp.]
MRVLITGIAGFAGSHLAEYLLNTSPALGGHAARQPLEIHGIIHRHDRRIRHLREQLHLHRGDLRNALWVSDVVAHVAPDYVVHLAAWSDVGGSWQQPWTTYELNLQCQLNLLEALRRHAPATRCLVITSNEVYGLLRPEDLPVHEDVPFRPNSPYGVSKVAQDMMALQYWNSHQMPIVRVRSFNHIGPGQADDFVASAFARQIAEIEAGLRSPQVAVGNLDARRDFTDVRDVVVAYWRILHQGAPGGVYNLGSGRSYPVRHILDLLLQMSSVAIRVGIDPDRLRPSDVPESVCDARRLHQVTGWAPQVPIEQSLHDLLDSWRAWVRDSAA